MTQALALPGRVNEPIITPLRKYAPPNADGTLARDVATIDALATLSAGDTEEYTNSKGDKAFRPSRSKDGRFVLHDPRNRAPGLKEELERRQYKSLIIGFGWNDPNMFVRQRVAAYARSAGRAGAGSLRIVGNANAQGQFEKLAYWENDRRLEAPIGSPKFDELWGQCSMETWLYFYLAGFDGDEPYLWFPDNVAIPYRLRFGGTNSQRQLEACLQTMRPQFAIMPIMLTLDSEYPLVMPDGKRGKGPVWNFAPMLAEEGAPARRLKLDSRRLLALRQGAAQQTSALALPAPSNDAIERAMLNESPLGEMPNDQEVELMMRGGPCEPDKWRRIWFQVVRDTPAATDEGRHNFIGWWTSKHPELVQTASLAEFLERASVRDAAEMIDGVLAAIEAAGKRKQTPNGNTVDTGSGEVVVEATVSSAPEPEPPVQDDEPVRAGTPEPDEEDPRLTQCANCGTVQICEDDGEGYTCLDNDACLARRDPQRENGDAPSDVPPDETGDTPDEAATLAWIETLARAYMARPEAAVRPADRDALLRLLRSVAGYASDDESGNGDAQRVLEALTSVKRLRDVTRAHCDVLQAEAGTEAWRANVERLRRVLGLVPPGALS
jgi:hypothetical protein